MEELFADNNIKSASDEYLEFMINGFECASRNRAKALGQFLTPPEIYNPMIEDLMGCIALTGKKLRIVDPFCGDGRLLRCFLDSLVCARGSLESVEVFGWDIDEGVLTQAETALEALRERLPFEVVLTLAHQDAFVCKTREFDSFDVCVTNPPWSSVKSLKKSTFVSNNDYYMYQDIVSRYALQLAKRFTKAKGKSSFGLGAVNLSRFGMELAVRLVKPGGACAIVMPSSFLTDTGSSGLRHYIFTNCSLESAHFFPAETKPFSKADQAGVALSLIKCSDRVRGTVFSHLSNGIVSYSTGDAFWKYSSANGYSVPVGYSEVEMGLMRKLYDNPRLSDCDDIHLGREVDETRINERLCEGSRYRFVKGFMVHGYGISDKDKWYFDDGRTLPPKSADEEKVVWRDVSRVSQKKRIQGTLLPPGHVAGNSLGVATCKDGQRLRAFLGVLNSSIFEFIGRSVLTTNHVSVGSLKRFPYPRLSDSQIEAIAMIVDEVLQNRTNVKAYREIDKLVAKCYGLTEDEYNVLQPLGFWSDYPDEMIEVLDDC